MAHGLVGVHVGGEILAIAAGEEQRDVARLDLVAALAQRQLQAAAAMTR
jgi:hypothetical protein